MQRHRLPVQREQIVGGRHLNLDSRALFGVEDETHLGLPAARRAIAPQDGQLAGDLDFIRGWRSQRRSGWRCEEQGRQKAKQDKQRNEFLQNEMILQAG